MSTLETWIRSWGFRCNVCRRGEEAAIHAVPTRDHESFPLEDIQVVAQGAAPQRRGSEEFPEVNPGPFSEDVEHPPAGVQVQDVVPSEAGEKGQPEPRWGSEDGHPRGRH